MAWCDRRPFLVFSGAEGMWLRGELGGRGELGFLPSCRDPGSFSWCPFCLLGVFSILRWWGKKTFYCLSLKLRHLTLFHTSWARTIMWPHIPERLGHAIQQSAREDSTGLCNIHWWGQPISPSLPYWGAHFGRGLLLTYPSPENKWDTFLLFVIDILN